MHGKLVGALLIGAIHGSKSFAHQITPFVRAGNVRNMVTRRSLDIPAPRSLANFPKDFMRMFDDFDMLPATTSFTYNNALSMDVKETKDAYELMVDVPGIDAKDVDVKVRGHDLTISAHREQVKKQDEENYHRIERYSGHLTRTVTLPENVDRDHIEAENRNGVLHVTIKKTKESPALDEKKIEIKQIA